MPACLASAIVPQGPAVVKRVQWCEHTSSMNTEVCASVNTDIPTATNRPLAPEAFSQNNTLNTTQLQPLPVSDDANHKRTQAHVTPYTLTLPPNTPNTHT